MQIPFLAAAAVGMTLMAISPVTDAAGKAGDDEMDLVGARLYASESHIDRWGDPVRLEDLAVEDLGRVESVVTDGSGSHLVVSVGGLWGFGAQSVDVGMDRLHLLQTDAGESRLVVDLSADGSADGTQVAAL